VKCCEVEELKKLSEQLPELCRKFGVRVLMAESERLTVAQLGAYRRLLKGITVTTVGTDKIIDTLRMGKKDFEIDIEKAPYVEMIYEAFLNGEKTREIAKKLNSIGVKTKRGNLFETRSVEYILSNPVYTGKFQRKGNDIVDGQHKPIIDEITYKKAQEILKRRRETKKRLS
jgi:hypothetical protein